MDGALLAELADLTPQDAWNARQFLERKAAAAGIRYEEADQPNLRRYRFRGRAGSRSERCEVKGVTGLSWRFSLAVRPNASRSA
ncbi:MAG: hypothetical protein HZY76_00400 [Anaerolineae bacterium]|nr:MAG: hypothetical protein HZY76_00400 [Anaerolineae bacterium]